MRATFGFPACRVRVLATVPFSSSDFNPIVALAARETVMKWNCKFLPLVIFLAGFASCDGATLAVWAIFVMRTELSCQVVYFFSDMERYL